MTSVVVPTIDCLVESRLLFFNYSDNHAATTTTVLLNEPVVTLTIFMKIYFTYETKSDISASILQSTHWQYTASAAKYVAH